MLAMPISSSTSSSKPSTTPPPVITFSGPDRDGTVYIQHPNGAKTPVFTVTFDKHSKPNLTISRTQSSAKICTATFSSLTGSITLNLNGQDVKMKDANMDGGLVFPGPMGEIRWKASHGTGMSGTYDLLDQSKVKIARYRVKGDAEPKLEVLIPCDDSFVDLVVCSGIALAEKKRKSGKEAAVAVEMVGHLLGA